MYSESALDNELSEPPQAEPAPFVRRKRGQKSTAEVDWDGYWDLKIETRELA